MRKRTILPIGAALIASTTFVGGITHYFKPTGQPILKTLQQRKEYALSRLYGAELRVMVDNEEGALADSEAAASVLPHTLRLNVDFGMEESGLKVKVPFNWKDQKVEWEIHQIEGLRSDIERL